MVPVTSVCPKCQHLLGSGESECSNCRHEREAAAWRKAETMRKVREVVGKGVGK
jgi:hypothetical protein